ncbi:MAG TPA: cytochrome c oxidase subunit 3 [Dehalococcoidia bacterium]|nr:cytochrome c oxidase subunit 3 [Dehalococcoidia bacterium]
MAMEMTAAAHLGPAADKLRLRQWGLWLFFVSEAFLFGAVASSRFFLAGLEPGHVDQALGLAVTSVLLTSSLTAYLAEAAAEEGDRQGLVRYLAATIVLGLLFMAGVGLEWSRAHFKPSDHFGTAFFAMTGLHSSHVASGIVLLALVLGHARAGRFLPEGCICSRLWPWRWCPHPRPRPHREQLWPVEATVKYWHFVDVVWVFFYPILYLMSWPS